MTTMEEKLARRDLIKQLGAASLAALASFSPRTWAKGEKLVHPAPALGPGCYRDHLRLFMCSQQTQQFDTGITRAADNANFSHFRFQISCNRYRRPRGDEASPRGAPV